MPEAQVGERALAPARGAPDPDRGRIRPQEMRLLGAAGVVHAHEHVGDRSLEPRHRDLLPGQAAVAREREARDERAGNLLDASGDGELAGVREDRIELEPHLADRRLLPEDLVARRPRLTELQVAWAGLVGGGRPRESEAQDRQSGAPHRAFVRSAAAPPAQAGSSTVTVYFARSASKNFSLRSRRRSACHSLKTAPWISESGGSLPG